MLIIITEIEKDSSESVTFTRFISYSLVTYTVYILYCIHAPP